MAGPVTCYLTKNDGVHRRTPAICANEKAGISFNIAISHLDTYGGVC